MEEKKLENEFKNNKASVKEKDVKNLKTSSQNQPSFNNIRNEYLSETTRPLNRNYDSEDEEPVYNSTTQRFPMPNQTPMLSTNTRYVTNTKTGTTHQMKLSQV